jgi:GLPGLI family protein
MIMKNTFKIFLLGAISLMSFNGIAQKEFTGKATYMSKTTVDLDKWGGNEMSPERKKMIMDRMKSFLEKTYVLTFNKTESIFKEEEQLGAPGAGGFGGMMGSFSIGTQYKNIKENLILQEQDFFGKQFLISDSIPQLKWEMTGETKQIGQYLCFKATAMKPVDEFDFSNMRPKRGDDKKKEDEDKNEKKADTSKTTTSSFMEGIEMPKEVEVTAWYTLQVPINNGPSEYAGLPGLILEVNSGRTTMLCTSITLNPSEKTEIEMPKKGTKVTKQEYADIVKKKMEEMREMYGGRGGRGGGRR